MINMIIIYNEWEDNHFLLTGGDKISSNFSLILRFYLFNRSTWSLWFLLVSDYNSRSLASISLIFLYNSLTYLSNSVLVFSYYLIEL